MLAFLFSVSAEWEAAKNSEQAKEAASQPVITEPTAASNTQAETFNQQVTMMPVQVPMTLSQWVEAVVKKACLTLASL